MAAADGTTTEAAAAAAAAALPLLNINVGVLGHVDSGKTSLVRALSTHLSTAALDKHPQSVERGITLDLGFSSFAAPLPLTLRARFRALQYTLVDCPGHASLIKTIIGGAQIIDMMLLVIDIVKGIQTQTAECLVVGEITTDTLVVVLNKVDMLPVEGRAAEVARATARFRKVLASTKFAEAPFVVLSAAPGGGGKLGAAAPLVSPPGGGAGSSDASTAATATAAAGAGAGAGADAAGVSVDKAQAASVAELVAVMGERLVVPDRSTEGPFLFAVDHCFPIKGQGTVLTGTVLSGAAKVNDTLELPELRQERKIKSIQMFKRPVGGIGQGDRAGVCVAGLDSSLMERGLACTPGAVPAIPAAIALVKRIRFFKGGADSESKFHVTVGHATVMATAIFFGAAELAKAGVTLRRAPAAAAAADAAAAAIVAEDAAGLPSAPAAAGAGAAAAAAATAAPVAAGAAASSSAVAAGKGGGGGGGSGSVSRYLGAPTVALSPTALALAAVSRRRATAHGIPPISYDWAAQYEWQEGLLGGGRRSASSAAPAAPPASAPATATAAAAGAAAAAAAAAEVPYEWQWAALLFDAPVVAPLAALVIGSHLDTDIHANACRIAFHGALVAALPTADVHELRRCNLYKRKVKRGTVDRVEDKEGGGGSSASVAVIGRSLFKKETDMHQFVGLVLHSAAGQVASLESSFGKGGKFRAVFKDPRVIDIAALAASVAEGGSGGGGGGVLPPAVAAAGLPAPVLAAAAEYLAAGAGSYRGPATMTVDAPPPIKAGDALLLRFRKYLYEPAGVPKAARLVQG